MTDPAEAARLILDSHRYAVLATVDTDGGPWATPVWYAPHGLDTLLWLSPPAARHSRALVRDPRVAVTVFDTSVEPGHGTAFYGRGRAGECPAADLEAHLEIYSARASSQGLRAWALANVSGSARHRLWRAVLDEAWVLLDEEGPERRIPVALPAG